MLKMTKMGAISGYYREVLQIKTYLSTSSNDPSKLNPAKTKLLSNEQHVTFSYSEGLGFTFFICSSNKYWYEFVDH